MEYSPEDDWSAASWTSATAGELYNQYLDYWEVQNLPDDPPIVRDGVSLNLAMDAAEILRDADARALAERGMTRGQDGRYSAARREPAAAQAGVFRQHDKTLAATMRRARHDTLHMAPRVPLDAPSALSGTASLLDRLFPLGAEAG